MIHTDSAIYKGMEKPDGFFGTIADGNVFCIMEAGDGYTKEEGYQAIALLRDIFNTYSNDSPAIIEEQIKKLIREGNIPVRVSLALGIIQNNTIFLKTLGNGQIWLRRGTEFVTLINGNHSASGPYNPDDTFLFTTESFIHTFAAPASLSSFLDNSSLSAGIEELNVFMKEQGRSEGIALFTRFTTKPTDTQPATAQPITNETKKISENEPPSNRRIKLPHIPDIRYLLQTNKKKKVITFGFVFIIICILIWSVGFGYNRRQTAQAMEKIANTKEIVTQKLNQSDEVSFLNPQRSMVLINEAHAQISALRNEVGAEYQNEVDELESMVKTRQDQITNKESKTADEFFDLTIDNKDAVGSTMTLEGDQLAIIDTKNGLVYSLSIEQKSFDTYSIAEAKSATIPVQYQTTIFFYNPGQGLYNIDDSGKAAKVIDADTELGTIADIQVYIGNLYFLSPSQNDIYKYVPTENGYSEKSSYFQSGQNNNLRQANSIAIDSSIYVANGDHILKFTAGAADEFKTIFPEEGVQIDKVITNADLEKVYAWDKAAGVLYILGKNGTYERQIKSSAFAKADDVVIFDTTAYTLEKEKINEISLL